MTVTWTVLTPGRLSSRNRVAFGADATVAPVTATR
jgi:hypothetical protein